MKFTAILIAIWAIEFGFMPGSAAGVQGGQFPEAVFQIAETFAIDVFPNDPNKDHYLANYQVTWIANCPAYAPTLEVCAKVLNDPNGWLEFKDYEDMYIGEGEPRVHRYTYEGQPLSPKHVHFMKTYYPPPPSTLTEYNFVKMYWEFELYGEYEPDPDNYAKTDCYTPRGNYFQKEVSAPGGGVDPYISFAPGEMGPAMLVVCEEGSSQEDFSQSIELHPGWNLVSWHILPIDSSDFGQELTMNEIIDSTGTLTGDSCEWFFDHEGEVYKYNLAGFHNSYPYLPGSGTWEWDLNYAYHLYLDDPHFWPFDDQPRLSLDAFDVTPDSAWDDTLDNYPNMPDPYTKGWFFMGYAAPGYSKLATIFKNPQNPSGRPDSCDYLGPFHWLFWDKADCTHYATNEQYLVIVKTDDGRVFIPTDPNNPDREIDNIGVMEPGRGYFLGFRKHGVTMSFDGWGDYPGWPQEGIPQDPKSFQKQIASANHFLFKDRTQWFYPVLVDTVDLEEIPMAAGDEIAVLDGDLCVGASVYGGEFPLFIACWKDDIATPDELDGYVAGNEMTFVWFDVSENQEVILEGPPQTQSALDDPVAPTHSSFGAGFYARRSFLWGVSSVLQLPEEYRMGQNYPNPFNSQTVIPLELPQRSNVKIDLYNLLGQRVETIFEGIRPAGWPRIRYDAARLASGIYFYRIRAEGLERGGTFHDVGKMIIIK